MKKILLPIILISILLSCRKEIDIDIPDNERKVVLNTIAMADSNFSANVFRSNHIHDKTMELLYLNNATINISENGSVIETLLLDTAGYYKGATAIALEGHQYEISVSVPNLDPVSAKANIPSHVPIISIDSIGQGSYDYYGYDFIDEQNYYSIYEIKFQDDPDKKDYYRLKINLPIIIDTVYYSFDSTEYDVYYYTGNVNVNSDDPSIEIYDWLDGYYYFSDLLFNGDEYGFEINVNIYKNQDGEDSNNKNDISISLEHISPDMFKYMKSIDMQFETKDMEMFFQAVPVFINVNNGYGIFGTANVSKEPLIH